MILRWPLAMIAADELTSLPAADRAELRGRIASWATLHAAGIADRCYRNPACFNNYKLADAVLNLELARSGVRSSTPGTRLYDPPALRRRALSWLESALPAAAPATATVAVPGRRAERATILSDPGTLPLAYASLCTAWAVRATELAAPAAAPRLRLLTRHALWGLVGVAAPDGEVSWSGRGQDQVWSLAATLYAAAAGSAQFAASDPVLAARLRRLADVELDALGDRLRDGALQVLPAGNDQLSGLDHYYSAVGSTGLALTWLELARDALPDPAAPRLALPSEIDRATFSDPARSGLVARRVGATWMGLRLRRVHSFDPRDDFGLARVLRHRDDGWHEERPERPAPAGRGRAPWRGAAARAGRAPVLADGHRVAADRRGRRALGGLARARRSQPPGALAGDGLGVGRRARHRVPARRGGPGHRLAAAARHARARRAVRRARRLPGPDVVADDAQAAGHALRERAAAEPGRRARRRGVPAPMDDPALERRRARRGLTLGWRSPRAAASARATAKAMASSHAQRTISTAD